MGKLGYSTVTLTDLTETIPISLVLETNQDRNIQTKVGNLFTPDFSKWDDTKKEAVEELIITPSLFLGNEELLLKDHPEYVKPDGRANGFIYYQMGEIVNNSEKSYYYDSKIDTTDKKVDAYVDIEGRLHLRRNFNRNTTIEAYIDNFVNGTHNYTITTVQAVNPINFLFLEEGSNKYSVIISSQDGRQHFEDTETDPIILEAHLYLGADEVTDTNLTYSWEKLSDGKGKLDNQTDKTLKVTRDDVYSEEKFLCAIKNTLTGLEYFGTIDIWDLKEKYISTITFDKQPLISENFNDLTLTVTTYDEKGIIIGEGDDGYELSYQWGYATTNNFDNDIKGETANTLIISSSSSWLPKKQSFTIYCRVYNKDKTKEEPSQISSVNEVIQFIPDYTISISPENIFIPTGDDKVTYQGNESKEYTFTFKILDKNGRPIPYDTTDSNNEKEPEGVDISNTSDTTFSFSFSNPENKTWDFIGTINIDTDKDDFWGDPTLGSKIYEFTFIYYGHEFTRGINLIKNTAGKSNYKAIIKSSSGNSLSSGDAETTLSLDFFYGDIKRNIEDNYYFLWKKDGTNLKEIFIPGQTKSIPSSDKDNFYKQDEIIVKAIDFGLKSVYSCYVYSTLEDAVDGNEEWVSYDDYTLTDLTETTPVSLVLKTNLDQNIQLKEGNLYTPNFDVAADDDDNDDDGELIVTPSFFRGTENLFNGISSIDDVTENLYYEVGEVNSNGERTYKYGDPTSSVSPKIYVDKYGKLHYKKNLTKNLTIEAYILNYKNKNASSETIGRIDALNPIEILLLEQGKNQYVATITGREYFDEKNKENITLTAELYKGSDKVVIEDIDSYEWDIVTDTDTPKTSDDLNWGTDKEGTDFIATTESIEVPRAKVSSTEIFTCKITLNNGLTFSASKILRDFTDGYFSQIIANTSLILTPKHPTVELTNQVWHEEEIINDDLNSEQRFKYSWSILKNNATEDLKKETSKTLTVKAGTGSFPKENFTILGKVIIDGKTTVLNYIDIKYSPINYSVEFPSEIFVPAKTDGSYRGTEKFQKTVRFKILDEEKNLLDFTTNSDSKPSLVVTDSDDTSAISAVVETKGKWDYKITLTLDTSATTNANLWGKNYNSKTYALKYKYLGVEKEVNFEVIKHYEGEPGAEGQSFSGYTVDLSNSFHAFAGGEAIAEINNNSTTTKVSAFYGDTACNITSIKVGSTTIYPGSSTANQKNLLIKAETSTDKKVLITFTPGTSGAFLTEIAPVNLFITITDPKTSKGLTFVKTFSYTINYGGKAHSLNIIDTKGNSCNTILYSKANDTYSPSSITVSATVRENNGAPNPYEDGKIIYSYDGTTWKYLGNSTHTLSGYKNLNKIYLRLYNSKTTDFPTSANGTVKASVLANNEGNILDMEEIPILTDLEGYNFGGENLIKWSKTIPLETNKWQNSSALNLTSDGDFSVMNFNITQDTDNNPETDKWYAFSTPKIPLTEDLRNKKLCLSFLFKCTDFNQFAPVIVDGKTTNPNYPLFICSCSENFLSSRDIYGSIGHIQDTIGRSTMSFETFENGKWCKVYKVFELSDSLFNSSENYTDKNGNGEYDKGEENVSFAKCNYFWIQFYIKNLGTFQIKQPKLEVGNVPSAWSASPYDVSLENISGTNLLSFGDSFRVEISEKEIYRDFVLDFVAGKNYAISWSNTSSTNSNTEKFLCKIFTGSTEEGNLGDASKFSKSFDIDITQNYFLYSADQTSTHTLRIYARNSTSSTSSSYIFTIRQLKVELGNSPTSYYMTGDLVQDIVTELELANDETSGGLSDLVTIVTGEGGITTTLSQLGSDLEKLSGSAVNINEVTGAIQLYTQNFYNGQLGADDENYDNSLYFTGVKDCIDLVTDSPDGAYIQISAFMGNQTDKNTAKNFYTKITSNRLSFYGNNKEIAYISGEKLQIKNAHFLNSFIIGDSGTSGELKVYLTDSGVGFGWNKEA